MKKILNILFLLCAAVFLLCAAASDAFADETVTNVPSLAVVYEENSLSPLPSYPAKAVRVKKTKVPVFDGMATISGFGAKADGCYKAYADSKSDECAAVFKSPDFSGKTEKNISGAFFINISDEGSREEFIPLEITLKKGDKAIRSSAAVPVSVPVMCCIDAEEIGTDIDEIRISFPSSYLSFSSDPLIYISSPFILTDVQYGFLESSSLSSLTYRDREAHLGSGFLSLKGSECTIAAGFADASEREGYKNIIYCDFLSDSPDISLSSSSCSTNTPQPFDRKNSECRTRVAIDGTHAVFSFHSPDENEKKIISLSYTALSVLPDNANCVVSSVSFSNGKLSLSGTLSDEIVRDSRGRKICVCLTDTFASFDEIADSESISTRFSVYCDISERYEKTPDLMYYIALCDDEDNITPLTVLKYLSSGQGDTSEGSFSIGAANASPVEAYISGAQSIIFDIDLSEIMTDSASGITMLSHGGFSFPAKAEYLEKVCSEINFFSAYMNRLSVRFTCSSPVKSPLTGNGLTFSAPGCENYMFLPSSREAVSFVAACASYFCTSVPKISSVVLSPRINTYGYTGCEPDNPTVFAKECTKAVRYVYCTLNSGRETPVPVVVSLSRDSGCFLKYDAFMEVLSEYFSDSGNIAWGVLYESSREPCLTGGNSIVRSLERQGLPFPMFSDICYTSGKDNILLCLDDIGEIADACTEDNVSTLYFSLKSDPDEDTGDFYHSFKERTLSESIFRTAVLSEEMPKSDRVKILCDFSSSFSPLGWKDYFGFSSVCTEYTDKSREERCLKLVSEETPGRASDGCIIIYPLEGPVPASVRPSFTFRIDVSSCDTDTLLICIGGSDFNTEYSIPAEAADRDGFVYLTCKTEDAEEGKEITYIGIVQPSGKTGTVCISSVGVSSENATAEQLDAYMKRNVPIQEDEGKKSASSLALVIGVFALVLIPAVTSTLIAKERKKKQ